MQKSKCKLFAGSFSTNQQKVCTHVNCRSANFLLVRRKWTSKKFVGSTFGSQMAVDVICHCMFYRGRWLGWYEWSRQKGDDRGWWKWKKYVWMVGSQLPHDLICPSMLVKRWLIDVGSQMTNELISGWEGRDSRVSVQVASWLLMVFEVSKYVCEVFLVWK